MPTLGTVDETKPKTKRKIANKIAKTTETVEKKRRMISGGSRELGVSGEVLLGTYENEEARTDDIEIADYVKMRQNDGTVAALYNLITLTILSNEWILKPNEQDTNDEIKAFVEGNFRNPPNLGGMTTPFSLTLSDMLRAVLEGFRFFEKVWTLYDGKIVYRKLAPRDASTISLLRDDTGGFDGAIQRVVFKNDYKEITIPKEKGFLFTYGKEKNFLYGESAFKAAYYHYDKKHKLYYLGSLHAQVSAVPPVVLKLPEDYSEGDRDQAEDQVKNFGVRTTVTLPPGYELESFEAKGSQNVLPLIEHHNAEIARSVLGQFLLLGAGSRTGSFGQSKNDTENFMRAIRGLMESIADHINAYVIPDLVELNFQSDAYPRFEFIPIDNDQARALKQAMVQVVQSSKMPLPEWFAVGLVDRLAESFDIDKPEMDDAQNLASQYDVTESKEEIEQKQTPETPGSAEAPEEKRAAPLKEVKKSLSEGDELRFGRPLTPAEGRVRFAEIDTRMDTFEGDMLTQIMPVMDAMKADLEKQAAVLIANKKIEQLASLSVSPEIVVRYAQVLEQHMGRVYEYGKRGASDEVHIPAPKTDANSMIYLATQAKSVADKQAADAAFRAQQEVADRLRRKLLAEGDDEDGIIDVISGALSTFFDSVLALSVSSLVSQALNLGRDDAFSSSTDIAAFEYSALLDFRTCPKCKGLDGMAMSPMQYRSSMNRPPVHLRCRCMIVAILRGDAFIPQITGDPGDIDFDLSEKQVAQTL